MSVGSLWMLCLWLFLDGATLGVATTPLLLLASRRFAPARVALAGALASALGSVLQMLALRFMLAAGRPWMRPLLPTRGALEAALRHYPSTSFAAILVARATPLPDAPLKLVAAVAGYPLGLYFLAVLLGSIPYFWVLALLGRRFRLPAWALAAIALAVALAAIGDHLQWPVWAIVAPVSVVALAVVAVQAWRGRDRGQA